MKLWLRRIFPLLSILYFVLTVFWGGFPLNRWLIDDLFHPGFALILLAFALFPPGNLMKGISRQQWIDLSFLTVILLAATFLAFSGMERASQFGPTVDEPLIVDPVIRMMREGSWDYRTYEYGGVYFYILLAIFIVAGTRMVMKFHYRNFYDIPNTEFYRIGRYATAFFHICLIGSVYFFARRFYGRFAALVSSLLLTFSYLMYSTAHQVRLDVILSLFVLLTHYFLLCIIKTPQKRNYYVFAGIFCGLAIGTKYSVAPLFLSLLVAHALTKQKFLDSRFFLAALSTVVAFLLFNLAPFIHLQQFLIKFPTALFHNLNPSHWTHTDNRPLEYFYFLTAQGMGYPAFIPILVSVFLAVFRKDPDLLVMWCFPAVYLVLISSYPSGFPRYTLPLFGNLSILAGIGMAEILKWGAKNVPVVVQYKQTIPAVTLGLLIIMPVWNTYADLRERQRAMKPSEVIQWMEQNLPKDSLVYADPTGPLLPERRFRVRQVAIQDFYRFKTLKEADYLCVTENLFRYIPDGFRVVKEFPAKTKSKDCAIRIYERVF